MTYSDYICTLNTYRMKKQAKTEVKPEKKQTNRMYLALIADRIASERPSADIILNTLIAMEERGYGRGYQARIADGAKFREKQLERRTASWSTIKNDIEDKCSKASNNQSN
jgi:hypothetical protein